MNPYFELPCGCRIGYVNEPAVVHCEAHALAPELLQLVLTWDRFMRDNYGPQDISWWQAQTETVVRALQDKAASIALTGRIVCTNKLSADFGVEPAERPRNVCTNMAFPKEADNG